MKSGRSSSPSFSGGFLPLRGVPLSGELGLSVVVTPDALFSGDVMAIGHLLRLVRSTSKMCVGDVDVLLLVPLKIVSS
jgi:hypothetical protein